MITILEQAESYRRFAQRKSNAHYLLAEKNKHKHTWLGVFVTLFSTIVGTTIFATITKTNTDKTIQIATGLLSVTAAVLSAFQTFFRFSEISQQHKNAATLYEAVRHKLDIFLLGNSGLSNSDVKQTSLKDIEQIAVQLNKISETAPTIPDKIWDKIKNKINMTPIIDRSSV
ncbi:MAG TPA: SLATT domain-containing protein [Hanamia sp.]|nr:SLATT domain-containing protein [Hanamia sp.]